MSAASLFTETFAAHPDGIWSAPGRVNLIGEHTDYNDGLVLPFAIELRANVALRSRGDRTIRAVTSANPGARLEVSLDDLTPGSLTGWRAYTASTAWVLDTPTGFDIAIDGSVPLGAGLSSSAALLCALTLGVAELDGWDLRSMEVAELARRAENDFVGAPTGGMDQVVAMRGVAGHGVLYDVRNQTVELVPLDPGSAGLAFVVIDTGVRHEHDLGEYGDRRMECEAAAEALGVASLRDARDLSGLDDPVLAARARHVTSENIRVEAIAGALEVGDWGTVGRIMVEGHASYGDDFEASCVEADVAVDALTASGALGARLTGGGFGGSVIALCEESLIDANVGAVCAAYAKAGFAPPSHRIVTPSDGARRDA
ncbi:MAG: galactokinase [Acidimicrobiia bacterium]|nr:MAG: galactokinase [Acidimicrobiia bacterium]